MKPSWTDAVSNSTALSIAIGVLIVASAGLTGFYAWITKVSKENRNSLEEIVRERVKDATAPLLAQISELDARVRTLEDGQKAANSFLAQALNADDLRTCKALIVRAMDAHA